MPCAPNCSKLFTFTGTRSRTSGSVDKYSMFLSIVIGIFLNGSRVPLLLYSDNTCTVAAAVDTFISIYPY